MNGQDKEPSRRIHIVKIYDAFGPRRHPVSQQETAVAAFSTGRTISKTASQLPHPETTAFHQPIK